MASELKLRGDVISEFQLMMKFISFFQGKNSPLSIYEEKKTNKKTTDMGVEGQTGMFVGYTEVSHIKVSFGKILT